MHITLESDYAIRIVHCLSSCGIRMDAKSVSEQTGVTLRFSLKILRKLVSSGIIKSFKGTQGGYEIARALPDISLKDVIETIEGPYTLARCINAADYICSNTKREGPCQFRRIFNEISDEVSSRLAAVTFDQLV